VSISASDRESLRGLAGQIAEIGALPVQQEKAELWRRLNRLEPVRPMVWVNEICWHEMNVDDELTLQTTDPAAQSLERSLRRELYRWRHLPCDMVVDDYLSCPPAVHSTGFGVEPDEDIVRTSEQGVLARRFHPQIVEPKDIEKLRTPRVTHDEAATERHYQTMLDLFGDILPIRKTGLKRTWCAPWDFLIRLWGVQEAMIDLIERPQMVHDAMDRLLDGLLGELNRYEELNLLSLNNDNTTIGSGGYGYTDELPGEDFDPEHVRPKNIWGSATAQIFSAVSPDMHWQFALRHEMRWLERWALTYYGCCEPLDAKMEILRRIPNLRKISMSPWVDPARAAG